MSLKPDDFREIMRENKEFMDDWNKKYGNATPPKNEYKNIYGDCDHPNTMENGTAIILYIVVMLVGAIFNDRWIIWIVATGIFLKFITRHIK